jgi:hypothetical protein
MIVVMLETTSAGGGDTSGFWAVDLWIDWLMICDIVPDIQKGRLSAYSPDSAYHAATAYCIGLVHGVGMRGVAGCWYDGYGANPGAGMPVTGTQADPFHRQRPSGDRVLIH